MEDVLKPCPFCGGEPILLKDHHKFGLYVACTECAACTVTAPQTEATIAWNRRAPTAKGASDAQP
jgi:Lar family restriction alleviation protein